ncbi:MAG: iron ABC transporter permease [Eubacteriales bacterium]|nr:iron ABC transporter permease [Eubacteriales bacterium]
MKQLRSKNTRITFTVMLPLGIAAFLAAFLLGSSGVSIGELIRLIGGTAERSTAIIFFNLRLPRALLAFVSGGALSISGACLQGMFKNPMADSYVVGVSSGAALGATVALAFSAQLAFLGFGAVTILAFMGALFAVFLVYNLAKIQGKVSTFSLLLSGIAISTLCSALVYCIMILYRDKMEHIVMWTMGSFSSPSWDKVVVALPPMLVASVLCLVFAKDLNIMLQGDEAARHLGVDSGKVRRNLIVITTLAAASAVSVSGIIGFVGLIIPHILRLILGPDHRRLLPYSFFGGGIFLLLADTLARIVLDSQEIPVGVITAVVGVPFFLYLLRRGKKVAK